MQADSRAIQVKKRTTELDSYLLQLDAQALIDNPFLKCVHMQLERYDIQLIYDFTLKQGTL
ncbi:MAG: hypothetical protein KAH77_10960, partial [Thiomargarita sp.]|nr:hypothetical protein [Thiomargarita sp.]